MTFIFSEYRRKVRSQAGFTLIEVSIAMGVIAIFLSALFATSSIILGLLRTAKDNVAASQVLQERVEEMRIANWLQITDANYLATTLFSHPADSVVGFSFPIETITVSAYPPKADSTPARVVRERTATRIVSSNAALKDERMVRVDINFTWTGFPRNRQRVRETSTLIAKGGISK